MIVSESPIQLPDALAHTVYSWLKDRIIDGTFGPGEYLPESRLAAQLKISKTPVREALKRLELEGFVEILPRRGSRVTWFTEKAINEIVQIREILEELGCRLTIAGDSGSNISRLRTLVDEADECAREGRWLEYKQHDIKFHRTLVEMAGNTRLLAIYNSISDHIQMLMARQMRYPERLERAQQAHRALVDALEKRDVNLARSILHSHMTTISNELVAVLRRQPGESGSSGQENP